MEVKIYSLLPFISDRVKSLVRVISSKPTEEFITALMHLTHSICSRASVKRVSPLPEDRDDRLSSKQLSPPRVRNSLSHSSLTSFSNRGRIPEKCFSDGVFKSLTHNSGSASAISPLTTERVSSLSLEIFRHLELAGLEMLEAISRFQKSTWRVPGLYFFAANLVSDVKLWANTLNAILPVESDSLDLNVVANVIR